MSNISENIKGLLEQTEFSASKKKRLRLIAVSKRKSLENMKDAVSGGVTALGENRIQEAVEKFSKENFPGIEKHFIGTIQSNKARKMLQYFDWFHALSTLKVARIIEEEKSPIRCLIQVNTSGEATKSGLQPNELRDFVKEIQKLNYLQIRGLMTIGPHTTEKKEIRDSFRMLRELSVDLKDLENDSVKFEELSMGMSGDYKIAIEEGSTMVRIGTAIFGERQ